MKTITLSAPSDEAGLLELGLDNLDPDRIHWNLPTPALYEEVIRRGEGVLSHLGPLVLRTGSRTGLLPEHISIVREPSSQDKIGWNELNPPFAPDKFDALQRRLCDYLRGKDLFIENVCAGADEPYRLPLRIISERAAAALFARTMFLSESTPQNLEQHVPEFTVIHAPDFHANPEIAGTSSDAFVLLHFQKRLILIGGTAYAGEIKKAVFTVLNYLLPQKGVLPLHGAANFGENDEDVAAFGLKNPVTEPKRSQNSKRPLAHVPPPHGYSFSENALIVLTSHSHRGVTRVEMADTAGMVVRHALCPVLVVPPA